MFNVLCFIIIMLIVQNVNVFLIICIYEHGPVVGHRWPWIVDHSFVDS